MSRYQRLACKAAIQLIKGEQYDTDQVELAWWSTGDSHIDGYCLWDYFDSDGRYLGADEHGIEPIVELN